MNDLFRGALACAAVAASLGACSASYTHTAVTDDGLVTREMEDLQARDQGEAEWSPTRGLAFTELMELRQRAPWSARPALLDDWIGRHIDMFTNAYGNHAAEVRALPPGAPFHRAEASFVKWLEEPRGDKAWAVILPAIYRLPDDALPTFDRLGFGLRALDAWGKSGADSPRNSPAGAILCLDVQCPGPPPFFALAMGHDVAVERVAKALAARGDHKITRLFFHHARTSGTFVRLWRATEHDESVWMDGAEVLIEEGAPKDMAWSEDLRRWWGAFPKRHGALLYVLALTSDDERFAGDAGATRFLDLVGEPATDEDLTRMLDLSPRALLYLPRVWGGFDRISHAQAIVTRIDAYFAKQGSGQSGAELVTAMRSLIARMCAARALDDARAISERMRAFEPGGYGAACARGIVQASGAKAQPPPPTRRGRRR